MVQLFIQGRQDLWYCKVVLQQRLSKVSWRFSFKGPEPAGRLLRALLVDGRDQLLADARGHRLLHRQQRAAPFGLLLDAERVDLDLAGIADRLQRHVVVALGDGLLERGRLAHGLFQRGADVGRQPVPELLVDDDGVAQVAVVRQRHMLLHLVHLLCVHIRRRILGAVDDAGLERLVNLGKRQHLRDGAEGAHLLVEHARGLDAHLQALEIGRRAQRPVGRHDLEAVVPERRPVMPLGSSMRNMPLPISPSVTLYSAVLLENRNGKSKASNSFTPSGPNLASDGASICTAPSCNASSSSLSLYSWLFG